VRTCEDIQQCGRPSRVARRHAEISSVTIKEEDFGNDYLFAEVHETRHLILYDTDNVKGAFATVQDLTDLSNFDFLATEGSEGDVYRDNDQQDGSSNIQDNIPATL